MDKYILDKNSSLSDAEWESFLTRSKEATLFNSMAWSDILCGLFGLNREILTVTKNGSITSGILIHYKKKFGRKIITRPPLTSYNGLLFDIQEDEKSQKRTDQQIEQSELLLNEMSKEYKFINLSSPPGQTDMRSFSWNKWIVKPQYTYILKLTDQDEIWNGFSSSLRRKIRHCEPENYIISESGDIKKLLELQAESYSRNKLKPPMPMDNYYKFVKMAVDKGICDVFCISLNGNIHSMRAVLKWKNVVYDWIAGSATDFRISNATHYLLWKMFKKYSGEKFELFDFMGANTKNITDFKRSFGGELTGYYDMTYYSSPGYKLAIMLNNLIKGSSRKQEQPI